MSVRWKSCIVMVGLVLIPAFACASGSGMPWESPMNQILTFDHRAVVTLRLGRRDHHHRPCPRVR